MPPPDAPSPKRYRIDSVDLLRGLVMVIMLLDHTRMFMHNLSLHIDPTDLSKTTAALFLTRWSTHIVAPVFVFLAGTGAHLQTLLGKGRGAASHFLWTRGLWLIFLEFTVVRFGLQFNLRYSEFFGSMQVIWAIGVSMIVLAGLIRLPTPVILIIGTAMIAAHNLLDDIQVESWKGPRDPAPDFRDILWLILHQPGKFLLGEFPAPVVRVLYPLIPWIGVMAAGFAFGAVYRMKRRRRILLLVLGLALTAGFLILRWWNGYGDPHPWQENVDALFTLFSFLNLTKYPPSLLFLLMTLGPALLLLAWFEGTEGGSLSTFFIRFGRVPLFFYLLQFFYAHGVAVLLGYVAGQPVDYLFSPGASVPSGAGFDLWVAYLFWILGLILLYPFCRWFAGIRGRHRGSWLSYL